MMALVMKSLFIQFSLCRREGRGGPATRGVRRSSPHREIIVRSVVLGIRRCLPAERKYVIPGFILCCLTIAFQSRSKMGLLL